MKINYNGEYKDVVRVLIKDSDDIFKEVKKIISEDNTIYNKL